MPTKRADVPRVLRRGLTLRCPACGLGRVFLGRFETAVSCGFCGWRFERCPGHWIGGNPSGDIDNLAAGTSGVAIATYHRSHITLPNKGANEREGWVILYGVTNDAPGVVLPIGGGGGPVPVGPWGPYLQRAARAAALGSLATGMRGAAEVARVAAADAVDAAKQVQAQVGKG